MNNDLQAVATRRAGSTARILVVDDEPGIQSVLKMAVEDAGYAAVVVGDGRSALKRLRDEAIDLVILDLGLPDVDGWELCREIRQLTDVRMLILTARDEDRDVVRGLSLGADDYVVKPFKLTELIARVRALLRRGAAPVLDNILQIGDLRLDVDSHEVHRGPKRIILTATEFKLLEVFLRNVRRVLGKDALLSSVWGDPEYAQNNFVEVYVGRLRRKLGKPELIRTVRGVGYVLRSDS